MVDVKFVRMTERFISLVELRKLHLVSNNDNKNNIPISVVKDKCFAQC